MLVPMRAILEAADRNFQKDQGGACYPATLKEMADRYKKAGI